MKRITVFLCTILLSLPAFVSTATANSGAATVHLILFMDTDDTRVGRAAQMAEKRFSGEFTRNLEKNTGVTVKTDVNTGSNFTLARLNSAISNLSTSSNDVIFFYYIGHGYNRRQERNDYPTITLGKDVGTVADRQKDISEVYNTLGRKQRRLLIVMAEACNKPASVARTKPIPPVAHPPSENSESNFRKLFLEASGDYLMASSEKGQFSILFDMDDYGFFTRSFFNVFREVTGTEYGGAVTWETVFNKVKSMTQASVRDETGETQTPIWLKGPFPVSQPQDAAPPPPPQPRNTAIMIDWTQGPVCNGWANVNICHSNPQTLTGQYTTIYNVPIGEHTFNITGNINCPSLGFCSGSGSGPIMVRPNGRYILKWAMIGYGTCRFWLE